MTVELLLLLLFFVILKKIFLKSKSQKFLDKIPGPKPYPIFGNVLDFMYSGEDVALKMQNMVQKYGPVYLLWMGPDPVICLTNPDDVEIVLGNRRIVDKPTSFQVYHPWVQKGLFTSEGEEWRKQRRMLTPAFTASILQSYLPDFELNAQHFIDNLSKNVGKEFDIVPLAAKYSFDLIVDTAMKHENVTEKKKMMETMDELTAIIAHRGFSLLESSFLFPFLKVGQQHDHLIRYFHGVTENMIKERKTKLDKEKSSENINLINDGRFKKPFLDLLLELNKKETVLTDHEVRMQVDTFMVAGYDTTQSAVSFALYCLSQNPDIQDTAYNEVNEIFGNSNRETTYQDLQEMKYLDKVIKESLRLYSTTRIVGRKTQEDIQLKSGYTIPKDCSIFVLVHVMHADPNLFPEPHIFNPERFENKDLHPFSYLPFGGGPRECIGKKFAMLSMKSVVSRVLRSFQLLPSKVAIVPSFDIIMRSSSGVHMKIETRTH